MWKVTWARALKVQLSKINRKESDLSLMQDWPQDQGPGALCLYHPSWRDWVEFFPGMHFLHDSSQSFLNFEISTLLKKTVVMPWAFDFSTRSQDKIKYSSLEVKPSLRISPCVRRVFESSASLFFMFTSASDVLSNIFYFLFLSIFGGSAILYAETRTQKQLSCHPYLIRHWLHAAEEEADCQCQIADWSICRSRWSSLCTRWLRTTFLQWMCLMFICQTGNFWVQTVLNSQSVLLQEKAYNCHVPCMKGWQFHA